MIDEQEKLGEAVFDAMIEEAGNISMSDVLILRSAWKGKLRWEEMPDNLRWAFWRIATCAVNQSNL